MKKIYFILFIALSFNGYIFSQTPQKFNLTKDGVKPVVIQLDATYSASLIYSRIKEWIAMNYKDPKAAIRIDNENSLVKFSCYEAKGWKIKVNNLDTWNDMRYTINVDIKDSKYRVTFATDETRYKVWYNSDGTILKKFKESETSFENNMNKTLTSLYNHIKSPKKQNTTDDW